jgi:hypothetical protein
MELFVVDEDFFVTDIDIDGRPDGVELIEWPAERRRFSCKGRAPATLAPTLTV